MSSVSPVTGTTEKPSIGKKVAAIAAAVATIAGILSQGQAIWSTLSGWYRGISPPPIPYEVTATFPSGVPSYLRYYYLDEGLGKDQSLHWFRASMRNKSRNRITLAVLFTLDPLDCEFVQMKEGSNPTQIELAGRQQQQVDISPALIWLNKDSLNSCYLKVTYSIKDDRGDKPHPTGLGNIQILPRHRIKWDLSNVERKPVSKDFVLATLSAWPQSREGNIISRATQIRQRHTAAASPEQWVKLCYDDLFMGNKAVSVAPTATSYPFEEETTLRAPGQVLSDGHAEPLEAALLMAAVLRNLIPHQVTFSLFVLPGERNPGAPAILVAWTPAGRDSPNAVDLNLAGSTAFSENLQKSSELLKRTLTNDPELLKRLALQGVSFGQGRTSISAIDFERARTKFHIAPLQ
ncbi:MAG: hypothetical protein ACR2IF_07360 [Terriglobales bacterium]